MAPFFLAAILVDTGEFNEGITVSRRAAELLHTTGDEALVDMALQQMRKAQKRGRP